MDAMPLARAAAVMTWVSLVVGLVAAGVMRQLGAPAGARVWVAAGTTGAGGLRVAAVVSHTLGDRGAPGTLVPVGAFPIASWSTSSLTSTAWALHADARAGRLELEARTAETSAAVARCAADTLRCAEQGRRAVAASVASMAAVELFTVA